MSGITGETEMSGILNVNSKRSEAAWLTGMNLQGNKYFAFQKTESGRKLSYDERALVRTVYDMPQQQTNPDMSTKFILKACYHKDLLLVHKKSGACQETLPYFATMSYSLQCKGGDMKKDPHILPTSPWKWLPSRLLERTRCMAPG